MRIAINIEATPSDTDLACEGNYLLPLPNCASREERVIQECQADVIKQERRNDPLQEAIEIARAEMVRRRRHLGNLTREQEIGIEDLLMSTAARLSKLLGKVL